MLSLTSLFRFGLLTSSRVSCIGAVVLVIDLVPVHVVEAQKHLSIRDFHLTEPVQHLLHTFEPLPVRDGDTATLQLLFDLFNRLFVILNYQTGTQSRLILILEMREARRFVWIVRVVVHERLSLTEVSRLASWVDFRDQLDKVFEHIVDFFFRGVLLAIVKVVHDSICVHIDTEEVQTLQISNL